MAGALDLNSNLINNVGDPLVAGDGMSRGYADTNYVNLDGTSNTMTGNIDMNNNLINNLGNALVAGDAVSRAFGDTRYVLRAGEGLLGTMGISVVQPTSPVFIHQRHTSADSP